MIAFWSRHAYKHVPDTDWTLYTPLNISLAQVPVGRVGNACGIDKNVPMLVHLRPILFPHGQPWSSFRNIIDVPPWHKSGLVHEEVLPHPGLLFFGHFRFPQLTRFGRRYTHVTHVTLEPHTCTKEKRCRCEWHVTSQLKFRLDICKASLINSNGWHVSVHANAQW